MDGTAQRSAADRRTVWHLSLASSLSVASAYNCSMWCRRRVCSRNTRAGRLRGQHDIAAGAAADHDYVKPARRHLVPLPFV